MSFCCSGGMHNEAMKALIGEMGEGGIYCNGWGQRPDVVWRAGLPDIERLTRKLERKKATLADMCQLYRASSRLPMMEEAFRDHDGPHAQLLATRYSLALMLTGFLPHLQLDLLFHGQLCIRQVLNFLIPSRHCRLLCAPQWHVAAWPSSDEWAKRLVSVQHTLKK